MPHVKYLLRAIQHDSRKHADWGRAALEIVEYGKIVGVEERKEVWDLLKKHADMEEEHRKFVAEIKSLTKTPALQYIFEQIMADEKKHHAILETLMTKRFEKDPSGSVGSFIRFLKRNDLGKSKINPQADVKYFVKCQDDNDFWRE